MATVSIPLVNHKMPGMVAIIDEDDYPLVAGKTWRVRKASNTFYAYRLVRVPSSRTKKHVGMHRLIMGDPEGMEVDHRDRNGLNNTRANLRVATKAENMSNVPPMSNNTSGYRGVHWHKREQKWRARIKCNSKLYDLGEFATAEEAARVRDAKAKLLHGEFAFLNFPDD